MLEKIKLLKLIDTLGLPQRGCDLVLEARVRAPVREVASRGGGNVITHMASHKMQCLISTESRSLEFFGALMYEHDARVLEYYPQPCTLQLKLVEETDGEIHKINHTPDFLVIRDDGVSLVEWKSSAKLGALAKKQPWRYQCGEDGRWRAPLIEQELAEWGIAYRICTDADISHRRMENLLALEDYFLPGAESCSADVLKQVRLALQEEPAIYLADLYGEPYNFSPDDILKAIADQELTADLDREQLTETRRCRVYRDEAVRELIAGYRQDTTSVPTPYVIPVEVGAAFVFQGSRYEIALVGQETLLLTDASGKHTEVQLGWLQQNASRITPESRPVQQLREQISNYTEHELRAALQRQEMLLHREGVSERTLRRWKQREESAKINGTNSALALVPRTRDCGNRERRLSPDQEGILERVIVEEWLTNRAPSFISCYRKLLVACDSAGIDTPSYPTLIARIKNLDHTHSTRMRYGKRRAYQEGDFVFVLSYGTPVHGSRPFQYCHIDHTQLDIELICSRTGVNLGRPWLTLAIDSFTRRIVAFYLTFDPPSYHSVMMAVREIVRRYGRLPQFFVVDNGKDFQSTNFELFLEVMGVHLRFRPAGRPRHGAVMERLFGRAHSEYVHNLAGNTKATKNVRMTTGNYLPKRLAEWSLEAMYYGLQYWAYEYYDQDLHPALGLSPRAAHDKGIAESGARSHRHIVCNADFLIASCPAVDYGGTRVIDRQRGVKVNEFFYFAPEFRELKMAGNKVPVRYDPWDASSVYAYVNHKWVRAINSTLARLGHFTEAERIALSDEYRNQRGKKPGSAVSMQVLREFMQTFTPVGAMALHRARQAENKQLYGNLGQAAVLPPVPTPVSEVPLDYRVSQSLPAAQTNTSSSCLDNDLPEFDIF